MFIYIMWWPRAEAWNHRRCTCTDKKSSSSQIFKQRRTRMNRIHTETGGLWGYTGMRLYSWRVRLYIYSWGEFKWFVIGYYTIRCSYFMVSILQKLQTYACLTWSKITLGKFDVGFWDQPSIRNPGR